MNLFILLVIEILLLKIGYKKTNRDLISPANFSVFIFIFATLFAIMGSNMWNVDFSITSVLYISSGLSIMILSQNIILLVYRDRIKVNFTKRKKIITYGRVNISCYKVIFLDSIVVILTALYVYDILKAGISLGAEGVSAISVVRYSDTVQTSSILRQGIKIIMAASFVESFVISRNIVYGWKMKDFLHIIPLICAIICSVFTGVRTEVLRIIFSVFALYYIFLKEKNNWRSNKIISKLFKKFFPVVILAALGFSSLKTLVKSSDLPINSAFSTIEYIAYYIGSPILVFGIKESLGFELFKRTLFGEITLNAFWQNLSELGIIPSSYSFIASTNVYISEGDSVTANVDTIFGGLMIDFGIWGMLLFIFVLYLLLSKYYFIRVKYKNIYSKEFNYMYYGFIFYIPAMSYYANLFGQFVAIYYILTAIFVFFIYLFYFKFSFGTRLKFRIKGILSGIYEKKSII